MQIFQARRLPVRLVPLLTGAAVAICAVAGGWQVAAQLARKPEVALAPEAAAALQHAAFTQSEARPGYARPRSVSVQVRSGETLQDAVERAGVTAAEAEQAVETLARAMDTVHIKAGMAFDAAVAQPAGGDRAARLIGLSLRTGPATAVTLSRTFDGALRLRALEEKVADETTVADGEIQGSLYESAQRLGATPAITAQVAKLFAHKLDFQRDIQPGDDFRLVFDRRVTESGRTIETGDLEYAELHGVKFFRFERDDGQAEYFDETGKNIRGFLLRTPVDGARLTSGFGKRRHPILGYARAHQGVDFGAGSGTPVLAAGDGVVVKAGRWGGYGNWLQIRHSGGWDTGYAHLSRYAKGLRPGMKVRQGQVVAYVGTTGLSTGPHLHYEVWQRGRRVNPVGAKVPQGTVLAGAELRRFQAQKGRVERLLAKGPAGKVALAAADR
ncbi:M23 family metallopeptidase [Phenylobacterium sp.]|uniref:M23 family metallopeptidase n=1 Tax=Phenylobacterium sp. TaxID=1871053 RepID=UPI0025F53D85|nr:M23 family metallopeptidase [Phenylobacterium sp.]